MEIPDFLQTQIREGKVVLFLGAGASMTARNSESKAPPSSTQLGQLLAERFLGGKYADHPLQQTAEYSISESSLGDVQGFIRDQLEPFIPSKAHDLICTFAWHGLATTNYDRLLEKTYESNKKRVQDLRVLIDNTDRVEENLRGPSNILLLKLHGCVTRTTNPQCPLILTTDQYIQYRQQRSRLFGILTDWSYEHPIVFIGHSLQDADIRAVLLELANVELRPRHFIVAPDSDEIKGRYWDLKKV
ncbi:MAG: SIR2 family NAD-dependent protein deacylase [Terriglobia bacterium]